ncbi:MAG: VCBS repeat-containing protein, partial [Verrucomicrobia bacterium]|nr:VCBS repeat-containing protein [Verrucomicrobiota bacterium]
MSLVIDSSGEGRVRKTSRPGRVAAWLGNLCLTLCLLLPIWQMAAASGPTHLSVPLAPAPTGPTRLTLMEPGLTGIRFTNHLSLSVMATNRVFENGSGVAAGDVDGDGRCDLFFCRLEGPNQLYLNQGGWKFVDEAEKRGVAVRDAYSVGAVFADVNGDGSLDLLVSTLGMGVRFFLNNGKGFFSPADGGGLTRSLGCTSMSLADVDADGDLDLYVATYRTTNFKDKPPGVNPEASLVDGKVVVKPAERFTALPVRRKEGVMLIERGEPDFLYLNDGKGRFDPVSWTDGRFVDESGQALKEPPLDWGLSVILRDLNGDGSPDIYVCNDFFFSRDAIWLNDGTGRFRAASTQMFRNISMSSMAVDVADINRDGFDDLFVADMLSRDHGARHRQRANVLKGELELPVWQSSYRPEVSRNTLFVSRGDQTFAELAQFAGVDATDWTWGCAFLDVDLDGYEDLLITNGNEHDVLDADTMRRLAQEGRNASAGSGNRGLLEFPRLATSNMVLRNRHDLTFEDRSR